MSNTRQKAPEITNCSNGACSRSLKTVNPIYPFKGMAFCSRLCCYEKTGEGRPPESSATSKMNSDKDTRSLFADFAGSGRITRGMTGHILAGGTNALLRTDEEMALLVKQGILRVDGDGWMVVRTGKANPLSIQEFSKTKEAKANEKTWDKVTAPRAPRQSSGSLAGNIHLLEPNHKFGGIRGQVWSMIKEGMKASDLIAQANAAGLDGKGVLRKMETVFKVLEVK